MSAIDLALLDTDILTEVLKGQNLQVRSRAGAYLQSHGRFAISDFTHFEVVRGLRFKQASAQLAKFQQLAAGLEIFSVSSQVLDRAADLWVLGRSAGLPHRDADLIIAATAIEHGRTLVTGNTSHFSWITGVVLDDWRR